MTKTFRFADSWNLVFGTVGALMTSALLLLLQATPSKPALPYYSKPFVRSASFIVFQIMPLKLSHWESPRGLYTEEKVLAIPRLFKNSLISFDTKHFALSLWYQRSCSWSCSGQHQANQPFLTTGLEIVNWRMVIPDVLHSLRSLLCTATKEVPHDCFLNFPVVQCLVPKLQA